MIYDEPYSKINIKIGALNMSNEHQHQMAGNRICSIVKCSECGAYHLNYRYLRLHISKENLNSILQAVYVYEIKIASSELDLPFKFTFGMVEITVYHTDFNLFKDVIEATVLKETELPKSILNNHCSIDIDKTNNFFNNKK